MLDERIYVIVPQTVQLLHKGIEPPTEFNIPEDCYHPELFEDTVESFPMVHGRLIAQGYHIGRFTERMFANSNVEYREMTAIVLAVRNSKELRKVSNEIQDLISDDTNIVYGEFHDTNEQFYGTKDRVHTITAVGPVTKEKLDSALGHLNLY